MCLIGSVGRVGSEGLEDSGPPSSCKHQKQELGRAALRHILPSRPSLAYFSDGVTAVTGTGLDSPVRTRVIPITRFQQAGDGNGTRCCSDCPGCCWGWPSDSCCHCYSTTRREAAGVPVPSSAPGKDQRIEYILSQPPCVAIGGMCIPTLQCVFNFSPG